MSGGLLFTALGLFAAGAALDLAMGVGSRVVRAWPYLMGLVGSALLVWVGVRAVTAPPSSVVVTTVLGAGPSELRLDHLAGLFLTLLFSLGAIVSLSMVAWSSQQPLALRRGMAAGHLALLGSVTLIICASDAFLFVFAWEVLTVSFYVLTSVTRGSRAHASAAWATLGMGKVSGAAILFGFLLLAARSGSATMSAWHSVAPGATLDVAWVLAIVGFSAKLGVVPFQVWIPAGYPAAPGPLRASLAGIGANAGVYGLWRVLGIFGRPPDWLVVGVLLAGGVTALLGITFAGVQSSLTRVVSYSSIENAGLITTAFGIAMSGSYLHSTTLEAVGLLAATLQMVTHAIAKTTLFVSLAWMESQAGSDDLDALRGIGRTLPWSGGAFAAGALALAGLPMTVGFVSEWFILEALMQQFRVPGLALRLGLGAAAALVALTVGLASLVFLRVLALSVLGKPKRARLDAREGGVVSKIALAVSGVGCLAIAAITPLEIRFLADGLRPLVPRSAVLAALKSPWVLQPVYAGFSILSPSWLWVVLPAAIVATIVGAFALSRGGYRRRRRVPSWHSATSGVRGATSYTAFAFANPLRHVLKNVLGTRRSVTRDSVPVEGEEHHAPRVEAQTVVVEPLETYVYLPVRSVMIKVSRLARRMQSGRLNAYVAYMLIAVLAAVAIVASMH